MNEQLKTAQTEKDLSAETAVKQPDEKKSVLSKIKNWKFFRWCSEVWGRFKKKHPNIAQFLVFFILSNGITVLQLAMMPIFKALFELGNLVNTDFRIWQIGKNFDGTDYYVFNYAKGTIGLAYFLAIQITLAIAQIINIFAQRNLTFKANNSVLWIAMWYIIAYIVITLIAAVAQGFYKAPIYNLFINTWHMGKFENLLADIVTMIINSAISFWVFFPIFKLIFKQKKNTQCQA